MKIQAHPDARLSQTQLEELRSRLTNKRQELADSIESLSALIQAKQDCDIHDAGDAASLQESRHRASILADQQKMTIAEIDAALGRLQEARYGVSETTGEAIAYDRLLLIPWVRTDSGN